MPTYLPLIHVFGFLTIFIQIKTNPIDYPMKCIKYNDEMAVYTQTTTPLDQVYPSKY